MKNKDVLTIKSLDKALKLLEYIANCGEGTSITELNRVFRFGKSTIYRLLTTMKLANFIRQEEGSRYILGYKIYELSHRFEKNFFLVKIGRRYLEEITKITNETSNLAILDSRDVVYLAKEESFQQLRATAPVGGRLPANCTALGKILLSGLDLTRINEIYPSETDLTKITPNSISDLPRLKKEIEKVEQEGIAFDHEESSIGIHCIGVPIKDYSGEIIAAISVSLPSQRAKSHFKIQYGDFLKKKAEEFSKELGYHKNKNL